MDKMAKEAVEEYYCKQNMNCAISALHALSDRYDVELSDQLYDAAIGMNGGGCYGGQCGLIEGPVLFLGVMGRQNGLDKKEIVRQCGAFTTAFYDKFGTILCKDLRPGGFSKDDPPHMCKQLCIDSIALAHEMIDAFLKEEAEKKAALQEV